LIGCAGCVLVFIGQGIASYFIIWLMGGLLYLLVTRDDFKAFSGSTLWALIYLAFFAIVLSLIRLNVYPLVFNDFSLGIATTLLLTTLAGREIKNSFLKRIAMFLSNISYSVYVTHLPLAVLISCALFPAPMEWSYINFSYYLGVVVIVLAYCYGMYFLFEKNTASVKKYIKHLGKRTIHA
jgi:peptidoglycan/LPS O-acetylase OafA/YrhL